MKKYKFSLSSKRWLNKHFNDEYVREVQRMQIRSRAWFKLNQIDAVDFLLYSGMTVVDLGCAPGGWSEYAKKKVGKHGRVISCDILPMDEIIGVDFLQGDFRDPNTSQMLIERIKTGKVDIVLSDICPNISGKADIDIPKLIFFGELALDFCKFVLISGGSFLVKVFQGNGFDEYFDSVRSLFRLVKIRKPFASYMCSREVYIVAKEYKI